MRVDLTIDELILVGFDPLESDRIGGAVERALLDALTPTAVRGLIRGRPARSGGKIGVTKGRRPSATAAGGVPGIGASIVEAAGRHHSRRVDR
jgi:hypothetical protein